MVIYHLFIYYFFVQVLHNGDFIATHAVIYAKLAWLNGYEVEIDTPWIPKEWLPIQPLENYLQPWDFLREFDIWTPFEDYKDWSPKPTQT